MRKIILLVLVSLITNISFSQVNITDLERVDGLWTKKGESKPYSGDYGSYQKVVEFQKLSKNFS